MRSGIVLLAVLFSGVSHAVPDRTISFDRWASRWARTHRGVVSDRWTADLDADGVPDLVAHVCLPAQDSGYGHPGAYLVEDARGRRTGLRHETGDYGSEARPCVRARGPVRVTSETVIDHDPSEKRETSAAELALRDGRLVVVGERVGSFHIPERFSYTDVSWSALTSAHTDGHYKVSEPEVDYPEKVTDVKRAEAILLVTSVPTPTATQLVRGVLDGPADAAIAVSITQPIEDALEIAITLTDDVLVDATSRRPNDVDAADHVAVWVGSHAIRIARDGAGWFSSAGRVVTSDPRRLVLRVPAKWADWALDVQGVDAWYLPSEKPSGVPEVTNEKAWRGSLVVAFADVDAPGGARTVVSTAPIPKKGEPHGILVKLPEAARWPTTTSDIGPL